MQVFKTLPHPPLAIHSHLTIGNFDGVHLGHQVLLRAMIESARLQNSLAGLLTFHPHPLTVIRPGHHHRRLSSVEERLEILNDLGLDYVVVYPFSRETASTSASDFVTSLVQSLDLTSLWVGPDFTLGRNREGNVAALQSMGDRLGFDLKVIEPQAVAGMEVRSRQIRQQLADGDVFLATRQLGRPYSIRGTVVAGARRGHQIGFPTANLDVPAGRLIPAYGVYATWVRLLDDSGAGSTPLPSVTNIGVRPSFDNGQPTVETHLLDYEGDLYGRAISLSFVERLRPEIRFANANELREQIGRDVRSARHILEKASNTSASLSDAGCAG
ncbi:MAG: bifunctional riboflavin kinase/FAD synthetase [Chloroflexota bacterium]|nr:bifunctional riboflavin kinase/FAD synthetase [Chloroflexota bacterium]